MRKPALVFMNHSRVGEIAVRHWDSVISQFSLSEISSRYLVFVDDQAGLHNAYPN